MQYLRQLSSRLSRVPALAYLSAYPLLILLFSLIFYALPSWYFNQAEPLSNLSPGETEGAIRNDLRQELQRLYRNKGADSLVINGGHPVFDQLYVSYMGPPSTVNFYFHLVLPVRRESDCTGCESAIMQADVNVFNDGRYIRGDTVYLPFTLQSPPLEYDQHEILVQFADLSEGSTPEEREWNAKLPLSQGLYDRIIDYGLWMQGPRRDRFAPVLYFSTAVATFGAPKEIVTRSTLAALLVFVEAGLAVLLIGLFVNSLAYRLAETMKGSRSTDRRLGRTVVERESHRPTKRSAKASTSSSIKGSKWWNRTWVKVIIGILLLGLCGSIGTVRLLRTLVDEFERVAFASSWMTWSTERPTAVPTPLVPTPTLVPAPTPSASTQLDLPPIERNLLQNAGFEDGLAGWTYGDSALGTDVSEISGIDGRAFCSRRLVWNNSQSQREPAAFVQKVEPVDPTAAYFYSAWVKMNGAVSVHSMARMSDWSGDEIGWALTSLPGIGSPSVGQSHGGWVFLHGEISTIFPKSNYAMVGIWHGLVSDIQTAVGSTVCVDNLVFGKIAE